jgi:hypothetical protein
MENKTKQTGIKFTIQGIGKFEIEPLKLITIISIAKEADKAIRTDNYDSVFSVIALAGKNSKVAVRIIAIAILNNGKRNLKLILLARKLMIVNAEDLAMLINAVIKQCGAEYLYQSFSTLSMIRMMDPLKESNNDIK